MANEISLAQYRRRSGQKAKAFGQLFESMFLVACRRTGIAITRFPDGCRRIGLNKLIQVRTPFDWICTHKGKTGLFDTKTSQGDTFAYSEITPHQIHEMLHHEIAGAIAGYVIWLRKTDDILFVKSRTLDRIYLSRLTGSIGIYHDHVMLIGKGRDFDPRVIFEHG